MVSHLFYYQLALLAIIWLFVMLHLTGSKPGLPTPVWSKNSCGFVLVVFQKPAEPFSTVNRACTPFVCL